MVKLLKDFLVFTTGFVNQLLVNYVSNFYFSLCQKKKYQKLNYLRKYKTKHN